MLKKDPIGLHNLFSIVGLGVSLLLLGFGGQFILDMNRYGSYQDQPFQKLIALGLCIGGALCLLLSIALILRMKWARVGFQVVLTLAGIAWMIFMLFLFKDSSDGLPIILGLTAFGITVALFGILFLESPYFLHDLQQDQTTDKERQDILDQ